MGIRIILNNMKYMKLLLLVFICTTTIFGDVFAQDATRIDLEISREKAIEFSGPMGSNRAFVSYFTTKPAGKKQAIEYVFFDQNLKETNRMDASVNVGEKHQAHCADSNGIYAVYSKTLSGDFSLLHCDGKQVITVTGSLGPKGSCSAVYAFGKRVVMVCADKQSNDFIITVEIDAGKSTIILLNDGNGKLDVDVAGVQELGLSKEVVAVYTQKTKESRKLVAMFFDQNLVKKNSTILSEALDKEKFLMTASLTAAGEDDYLICGTYQNEEDDYSNGMYMGRFKAGNWTKNSYYSWTKDFTHFTDYLSEKAKGKVDKKKDKAESKGKEYDMDVLMITHELSKIDATYMMVGEIYYPEYQTYTDSKGVTTRTFVGYRYQQAVIVGFDENLDKQWDQSFAIGRLGGFVAWEIINVTLKNKELSLYFESGNTIRSKVFDGKGAVVSQSNTIVKIADEGEEVRSMYAAATEYWHDDIFLATGSAKTKDNRSGDKELIFYMSAVKLEKAK